MRRIYCGDVKSSGRMLGKPRLSSSLSSFELCHAAHGNYLLSLLRSTFQDFAWETPFPEKRRTTAL